ncbi:NAD(P)-binding protein [Halorussus marinus]|uniref:NAD(P)-binding protein n=1 Tax=Halorussus marinus TaxID=2505976 RepID=UPI001092A8B8|nr:NAD(P)-binding protein [Halorussus marinus]
MSRNGPTAGLMSAVGSGTAAGSARRRRALVVGGGHVGRLLAERLATDYEVTFLATAPEAAQRADESTVTARHVEEISAETLDRIGAGEASLAVVASRTDGSNLLAAQLLRTRFGVDRILMLVNDPDRVDSLETLDVDAVCASDLVASGVNDRLKRSSGES